MRIDIEQIMLTMVDLYDCIFVDVIIFPRTTLRIEGHSYYTLSHCQFKCCLFIASSSLCRECFTIWSGRLIYYLKIAD